MQQQISASKHFCFSKIDLLNFDNGQGKCVHRFSHAVVLQHIFQVTVEAMSAKQLERAVATSTLPWDVLSYVMRFLRGDQYSISRYMRTCRALYAEGISVLMRDCSIAPYTNRKDSSFLRFILDDPERPLLIRKLVVYYSHPTQRQYRNARQRW